MGRFNKWLQRKLLGKEVTELLRLHIQLTNTLNTHIANIMEAQAELAKAMAYLATNGPPHGWVDLVTNSFIGMNARMEAMAAGMHQYEAALEKIFSIIHELEATSVVDKTKLN